MNFLLSSKSLSAQYASFDANRFKQTFPSWKAHIDRLCELQGHKYQSTALALTALTHRSALVNWPSGQTSPRIESNERLEFLGDALLGAFLSVQLMSRHESMSEGELSRARSSLASTRALASKARQLGLGECVFMGKGELLSGGAQKESLLADVFEATVAALFIDAGQQKAWEWLDTLFDHDLERAKDDLVHRDAKSALQEWMQSAIGRPPDYRLIEVVQNVTDVNESRESFCMGVFIGDREISRAVGGNKAEASQKAATAVFELIRDGQLSVSKVLQLDKEDRQ